MSPKKAPVSRARKGGDDRIGFHPAASACYGVFCDAQISEQAMSWSEADIVRALARAGTKGLTKTGLAKAMSVSPANKQFTSGIAKLKSRGEIRGPFRMGRCSLYFETGSAPTTDKLATRIEDLLRRAGTRVTTRSALDKGMTGVVQSFYNDAISGLKSEGKIVELRDARRSKLYVHREAIIDQLRVESGDAGDCTPLPPTQPAGSTSISLDDVRPHYQALKLEQGGISTVAIYDILRRLGVSKDTLHALLLREARRGRVSLHAASTVNFPQEVIEAGIRIEGERQPYVTFILREDS